MSEIRTDDGGGLYTNSGLIDTIAADINDIIRDALAGNYLFCCGKFVEITQKLNSLKGGIKDELKAKDDIIKDLQRLNNELAEKAFNVPVDKTSERCDLDVCGE